MEKQDESTNRENLSRQEIIDELSTDPEEGLSEAAASSRLEQYGENKIEAEHRHPVLQFLSYFWGPIPWMIEAAVILSAGARHWEDLAVILSLLLINGCVGFWHESKAGKAIAALKEMMAPEARVLRDKQQKTIAAEKLVPGDIIFLSLGDVVPADARLVGEKQLSVDESALTGESLPVSKKEGDSLFSGTTVKQGRMKAVVTATGQNTQFARTVELVGKAGETSHFQKAVLRIGYFLIVSAAVLVLAVVVVSLWRGDSIMEVVLFAMVLIIAGIPAAMPAVLSVTMSIGAHRLAAWKAIVSRLAAMEEMAGLQVLCADKTGTLTKNELELQEPVLIAAGDRHDLLLAAALTTEGDSQDPIDKAVRAGLEDVKALEGYEIIDFRPFDPTRKRADADIQRDDDRFTVTKGAPQVLLDLVAPDEETRNQVRQQVDDLGKKGFRCLGCARKQDGNWTYLGLLPLLDPPREDTPEVITTARDNYHLDIRMVTGDHPAIGKQVAKQIGLGQNIRTAGELFQEEKMHQASPESQSRIDEEILRMDGFAEVTPEHKFKIIRSFQDRDHIVGMTGDGVNDAPALKQADVGIAVVGATDAARSASDLVLTEQGLGVITRAIEEARRIFERMTSYATYRITETIRLLLFISLSILAFDYYPVTAIMIVLLAILNDISILTIAWDKAETAARPVRWNMFRVLTVAAVLGVSGVFTSFLAFWVARSVLDLPQPMVQTIVFLKLLVAGHLTIFLTRNRGWIWDRPLPSAVLFLSLEGTQIIGTLMAVYGFLVYPIGWGYALAIWGYAIICMLILDALKVLLYKIVISAREASPAEE